jgi:hypothetical protein
MASDESLSMTIYNWLGCIFQTLPNKASVAPNIKRGSACYCNASGCQESSTEYIRSHVVGHVAPMQWIKLYHCLRESAYSLILVLGADFRLLLEETRENACETSLFFLGVTNKKYRRKEVRQI